MELAVPPRGAAVRVCIADAAPYFEAAGGVCRVSPVSRERVVTQCERPSRLIRRELFFDGGRR